MYRPLWCFSNQLDKKLSVPPRPSPNQALLIFIFSFICLFVCLFEQMESFLLRSQFSRGYLSKIPFG